MSFLSLFNNFMKNTKLFLHFLILLSLTYVKASCNTEELPNDCSNETIELYTFWSDKSEKIVVYIKPKASVAQIGDSCNYGIMISNDYIYPTGFFTNSLFHTQNYYYAFTMVVNSYWPCRVEINKPDHNLSAMTEMKFSLFKIERSFLISEFHDNSL